MSDSIVVRVTLDAYDMASTGRQTQVYVQIPEVARVSWLLPEDRFHGLKDRAWPEVLDVTHAYVTYGGAASNSATTAAWKAVMEWLRDDANRDEMQAAWEQDQARRHPVARKLLAKVTELEAELYTEQAHGRTFLEQRNAHAKQLLELRARLAEYERPADEDPIAYTLANPQALRAEDTADLLTLAPAQHATADLDPAGDTILLEMTATREQWSAWQTALKVDLARTTNRGAFTTSHATWRGIHVVISRWHAAEDGDE